MRIAVLGSGSWGTALAILLARNRFDVVLMGRNPAEVESISEHRENLRYLPGHSLPENLEIAQLAPVTGFDIVVVAVPASGVLEVTRLVGDRPIVVVAAKGLEAETGRPMCDLIEQVLPNSPSAILSGPNLAVEIANGIPTVALAASSDGQAAETVRDTFSSRTFRVSVTDDVIGVELAGALKNVLAIGAGMSDGLGFGDNTKGAFLSRGLLEMDRLGKAMGARSETFLGPAGVGDLFATAASRLSRNYRLGLSLGRGESLENALSELGQVAEGVPTARATLVLAKKHGVELPVFAAVNAVIDAHFSPLQAVSLLMERGSSMRSFDESL
jgi:glycerol-3-phosphate dehydrogenase (NAD(P)+)